MTHKRFTWIMAIVMCLVLGVAGVSSALDFGWPTPGITGLSTIYYYSNGNPHSCRYKTPDGRAAGVDILAPMGTEVLAPASGTVKTRTDLGNTSFGKYIELQHEGGTITLFAHLSEFRVSLGQSVNAGDVIGLSGSTGNSTGPHLHYEMSNMDTYRYYEDNGYNPPIPYDELPFNQGLRNLTSSKYAKIFTLTSGRYYNLYSNKELTSRLSSTAWTGENDEVWLQEVGVNSRNIVYAKISYPTSSARRDAYVRLRELFVRGTENSGVITAKNNVYGLYKRLNSGQTWSYGIDAGDPCYLLTYENEWCQVLYPITGRSYSRIAWMTAGQFYQAFGFWPPGPIPPIVIPPTIASLGNLLAEIVAGTSFTNAVTATGDTPITWSTSAGTLPDNRSYLRAGLPSGLSISGTGKTGTISGTPSHISSGQSSYMPLYYCFNVKATNAGGSDRKSSYIVVWEPPVFETSSELPRGDLNTRYNQTIRAKGTEHTMHWSIIKGKLPPGLTLNTSNSKRTATITGVPTQTGVFRFTVKLYNFVGNSNTTTTREFVIYVGNPAKEYSDNRIKFTYNFVNGRAGSSFYDWTGITDSSSSSKRDLDNYIFSVSEGSLPTGLSLEERSASNYNVGKLYLSGIPKTSGTYSFTLKAKRISDGGYNTRKYSLYISPATTSTWRDSSMTLRYTFLSGKMRVNYRDYIYVRGGSAPYTPSVVAGELPPGTRLEASGNYIYLTGVPKRAGSSFSFTMRVTGSNGGYVQQAYTVNIATNPYYRSGGTSNTKPKYISKELPNAEAGNEWEATLECSGAEPIAWYAVGDLPEWMTLDEATGRVSGIPMEPGKYKFKIKAENEIGSVTKTFKLKVVKSAPTIVTASLPDAYTGVEYEARLEAFGTDPIKWSKIGKLPSGLKLNKKEGIIYGTPRKSDSFDITVRAKNKAGSETATLKIRIFKTDNFVDPSKDIDEVDDDDDDDDSTSEDSNGETKSADVHAIVSASSDTALPTITGHVSGAVFTKLYLLNEDERLEGSVYVEAGTPLAFEIGQWQDEQGRNIEVDGASVYVNDEAVSADISEDGLFTLPAEMVSGEITVYVSAQSGGREFKTLEVNAITGGQKGIISASSSANEGSTSSSSGGCNSGILGVIGIMFAGIFAFGRKYR